jgi:glycosyltransferase involved in cell wall biosynthesis
MPPPALHVLTFARDLRGGGVERAQLRLARGWIAAGARVTLLLGSDAGPLAAELPREAAVVTGMNWRTLPGLVRKAAPDILFCGGNTYTGLAAWTKLRLGRACPPIVGKMSNAPVRADHGWVMRRLQDVWLGRHGGFLDHLVAMTPVTAEHATHALRMEGRVSVIPNPPAVAIAHGIQPTLPERYILGVGRLERQKRWDRLIAAMPQVGVSLVILGEGSARVALEAQVAALGLAGRVHLPGHVGDPLPAMAGAAVLALTSDFEGVPGVLREALSVGTPVVATDCSRAVEEIVGDPSLGTIVGRDDSAALVAALDHWLLAERPSPVPQPGVDSTLRYLALFNRLISQHSPSRSP